MPSRIALSTAVVLAMLGMPAGASAESAGSGLRSIQAGWVDVGDSHSCAVIAGAQVRCWGIAANGRLGYGTAPSGGDLINIGDDEYPDAAGAGAPVDLGAGRTARAISVGGGFTCALLDTRQVRCWGRGLFGATGQGSTVDIGDDETPGSVAPLDLGAGRTARAISAGDRHGCAILDTGQVRCWGEGAGGKLGDPTLPANTAAPASVDTVDLGPGRTATAIATGASHTCAILDTGQVRCWGVNAGGQLGTGVAGTIGDNEAVSAGNVVDLGSGRTAVAITAGAQHSCAILDTGAVRCWGANAVGQIGTGAAGTIGDNEPVSSVGPVDLGAGRTAIAITAGASHTCATLDTGAVRCWGDGAAGRLGYENVTPIGDTEVPSTAGPVNLGGRAVRAIAAGQAHTCVSLIGGDVRCWGSNGNAQLGSGPGTTFGQFLGDAAGEDPGGEPALRLGGDVIPKVADLSLSASAPAAATAGRPFGAAVAVTNAGPDPAAASIATGLGGLGLDLATPGQGAFQGATGVWKPGVLAAGGQASLALGLRAPVAGSFGLAAEVTAGDTFDPDSSPGNGVAGEDDQASATVTAAAAAVTPPAAGRRAAERVTLASALRRLSGGRVRVTLRGRLVATRLAARDGCRGGVALSIRAGRRTLARRTARLRLRDGACEYQAAATVTPPKGARRLTAAARFGGNTALLAKAARSLTIRLGR
ncbi:MAG: hypothetical protein U0R70_17565 [Solirubrobacteraceae bacterium]